MKNTALLLFSFFLTTTTIPLFAEGEKGHHKRWGHDGKEMTQEGFQKHSQEKISAKMERISKKLKLSEEQKSKIQAIIEAKWQKKWEIKKEKQEKMKALREETREKIQSILNPKQQQKWEKMKKDWKKGDRGHHREKKEHKGKY